MSKQWLSIAEIAKRVQSQELSALELVEDSLKRIDRAKEYQTIVAPIVSRSKKRAKEIDNAIKKGEKVGRLAGVPFIAKDNFLVFGAKTTASSNMLKNFDAPYQSTAIEKLEAEGAICVAKANLDAFAHGSSTENSDFFTTKNPHDKQRVPGGSSGGSASAVALDLAPFALGTDTGGSIRLPASFCGVVGYKPTYGLVSRSGVIAMASSTDVIGPITRTVEDSALVLDVMAGKDNLDSTTIERDKNSYADLVKQEKLRIGVVKEFFEDGLDEKIKKNIKEAILKIEKQGHKIVEVSLPSISLSLACYYILCPAEVSSNLSRYDGLRFGHHAEGAKSLNESYELSRSQGFGKEAKRRIMIGTYVLSSGYYDAYYKKAQTVRTKLIGEFNSALKEVDVLVGPTAPRVAFKIGENIDDPLAMYLTDIMTVSANLVGVPAISLPSGSVDGLPVGLQVMSAQNTDRQLLSFANQIEGVIK
ncbi:MAG: Asp-tRNA(Asn)/Glu-tRNA(Gln) amidotransferase subunit GatA [Candidatus Nomurabacteria bacterium]|nr:MAG: Asp-tRNA(Asn)/Glu-tRNA(Gln) amidotransferase subunit GatA [Candidatus Nomurabacteria bacterium]